MLRRLNWPQVAALAVIVAGIVGVAMALPEDIWTRIDWKVAVGVASSLVGLYQLARGGAVVHPTEVAARMAAVQTLEKPLSVPPATPAVVAADQAAVRTLVAPPSPPAPPPAPDTPTPPSDDDPGEAP